MLRDKVFAALSTQGLTYVGGYTVSGVGSTSDVSVSLTSLSGGVETQPGAGDLVLVGYSTASNTNRTPRSISGYANLRSVYVDDVFDTNHGLFFKIMGETPDTTLTLTGGSGSTADAYSVYVSVWRNFSADYPFAGGAQASANNSILANPPAVTPLSAVASVVAVGSGAYNGAGVYSSSDLTDFKNSRASDTYNSIIGGGYIANVISTIDPAAFTYSANSNVDWSWAASTIAVRPKGGDPSFESATTASTTSSTLTISVPSGVQDGDLLVAVVVVDATNSTITTPEGFTSRASRLALPTLSVMTRVASSEPASYSFGVSDNAVGAILHYKAAYVTAGASASSETAPSIDTAANNMASGIEVAIFGASDQRSVNTPPSGMTQRVLLAAVGATIAVYDQSTQGGIAPAKTISWSGNTSTSSVQIKLG